MPLIVALCLGALFSVVPSLASVAADDISLHFKTTPRLELLRPFADPIDLSLLVTGADGRPLKQGSVNVRLQAPPTGRIFSTDYPLVEGTLLNEMRLPLRQGKADWKFLFPVRGVYRLGVEVESEDGRKAGRVFEIAVRENRTKWLALAGLSAGLFFLGFIAGRIFTGAASAATIGLLAVTLSGAAQSAEQGREAKGGMLEISAARVGEPASVRWRADPATGGDNEPVLLSLSIAHLEKEKIVFAMDKVPVAGEWSMRFHFPDGAEYRVVALGQIPGRPALRSEQVVAVTGVEPPARAMVPALGYFLALLVLGLAAGRWSKRRGF